MCARWLRSLVLCTASHLFSSSPSGSWTVRRRLPEPCTSRLVKFIDRPREERTKVASANLVLFGALRDLLTRLECARLCATHSSQHTAERGRSLLTCQRKTTWRAGGCERRQHRLSILVRCPPVRAEGHSSRGRYMLLETTGIDTKTPESVECPSTSSSPSRVFPLPERSAWLTMRAAGQRHLAALVKQAQPR